MSEEQRATSLNGLAKVIARRLQAIRDIAAEKNEQPPLVSFKPWREGNIVQRLNLHCGDAVARHQAGA